MAWVTSALVGMPFSIGRSGAGAGAWATSPSWAQQACLGRHRTSILNCAGIMPSRSEKSSPIRCLRPPQYGQVLSTTSMMTSSRGRRSSSASRLMHRLRDLARFFPSYSSASSAASRLRANADAWRLIRPCRRNWPSSCTTWLLRCRACAPDWPSCVTVTGSEALRHGKVATDRAPTIIHGNHNERSLYYIYISRCYRSA